MTIGHGTRTRGSPQQSIAIPNVERLLELSCRDPLKVIDRQKLENVADGRKVTVVSVSLVRLQLRTDLEEAARRKPSPTILFDVEQPALKYWAAVLGELVDIKALVPADGRPLIDSRSSGRWRKQRRLTTRRPPAQQLDTRKALSILIKGTINVELVNLVMTIARVTKFRGSPQQSIAIPNVERLLEKSRRYVLKVIDRQKLENVADGRKVMVAREALVRLQLRTDLEEAARRKPSKHILAKVPAIKYWPLVLRELVGVIALVPADGRCASRHDAAITYLRLVCAVRARARGAWSGKGDDIPRRSG